MRQLHIGCEECPQCMAGQFCAWAERAAREQTLRALRQGIESLEPHVDLWERTRREIAELEKLYGQ